jgi:hypothetical protein
VNSPQTTCFAIWKSQVEKRVPRVGSKRWISRASRSSVSCETSRTVSGVKQRRANFSTIRSSAGPNTSHSSNQAASSPPFSRFRNRVSTVLKFVASASLL